MTRRAERYRAVAAVAAVVLIAAWALRDVVTPGPDRLPGNDAVNLYFWEVYTRKVLATGALPFWNPYHMTGAPHLADVQTTVLYPPAMLLRLLLPPMAFLPWMAAAHVLIAGLGGLFLARVLGVRWMAAVASATGIMLGGSVGAWLYNGHLLVLYCTSWLPWALGLAIVSVRRDSLVPHPGLVIVMALQFLAGYLQGSLYITAVIAGYFVYSAIVPPARGVPHPRRRPLVQLMLLGVVAIGLSAFQLFPVLQLTAAAGRTSGLPYEVASEGGLHLADLARVLFPFRGAGGEPAVRFLADALTYISVILFALVPFSFSDRRRRHIVVFLTAIALTAIAFASAGDLPFFRLQYLLVPGLRIPGRLLFVATVALAALGAIGFDAFIEACSRRSWRPLAMCGAASLMLVAAAAAVTLPREWPVAPSHLPPALPFGLVAFLACVGGVAAAGWRRAAAVAAAGAVAVDLVAFVAPAAHSVPIDPAETLRRVMGPPDGGRGVSACENRVGAGEFLINGQATLDGLAAMHLADYADWAALATTGAEPPRDGLYRRVGSEGVLPARPDLLNLANVSVIYSCEPIDVPNFTFVSHVGPIYRYRNDAAWPRAFWTCDAQETTQAEATAWLLNGRYDARRRLRERPSINVRWAAGVTDDERRAVEARRHLLDGTRLDDDSTWRYALGDVSEANGLALVMEPFIEDTAGIERHSGHVSAPAPGPLHAVPGGGYWVIGARECTRTGTVRVLAADRPDGLLDLEVDAPEDGFVFISEARYPERRAFVDGEPASSLRADLAFTAVAVPAGRHRVQLRYVPRTFQAGLGVSALTLVMWLALPRLRRRSASAGEAA